MGTYFADYQNGTNIFCDISFGCEYTDSESRMRCQTVEMVTCGAGPCNKTPVNNGLILCDCGDSWNCNLCGGDVAYWNPINSGDPLYFQFQQIDPSNGQDPDGPFGSWGSGQFAHVQIFDCCTNEPLPVDPLSLAIDYGCGVFPVQQYNGQINWRNIQMIEFDTESIIAAMTATFPNWDGCFYFDFSFENNTSGEYHLCSEPFKVNNCTEKDDTVLLEGEYSNRDCFEYYYGSEAVGNWTGNNSGQFIFRNFYRVRGFLEPTGYGITKSFVGSAMKTTSVNTSENYILKIGRVPFRVANLLATIFSAKSVYVNNDEFVVEGDMNKNNDLGTQWFPEVTLKKTNCTKTFCQ